jgi:hypothetical protein
VNRLHFGYRETAQETVLQHVTMPDMMTKFVLMMKKNRGMPTYPFDMSFYEQVLRGSIYTNASPYSYDCPLYAVALDIANGCGLSPDADD